MYQVLAILDNLLIQTVNAKRMRLASTVFLRPGKQKSRQRDPIHTQMRFRNFLSSAQKCESTLAN